MATAMKIKPATPTDAAGNVLQIVNKLTLADHAKTEAGRKTLARLVRAAAEGQAVGEAELVKALADGGETPQAFAAEVQGLIKRKKSVRELIKLRHFADVVIPAIKAEAEAADAEFRKVREKHEQRVRAILAKIDPLQHQIDTSGFHQRWVMVFGRGTPKTLTIHAALHKAEAELAKLREARDHWEAKSTNKRYSADVLADATASFERHKKLVAAAREKVEELKRQLDEAERALMSAELQIRYDRAGEPPTTVRGTLVPASAFGGPEDELVEAPTGPVTRAG